MPDERNVGGMEMNGEQVLAPVIGAVLTNAFYTAELLHARTGTNPPREDIHHEVLKIWLELTSKIVRISQERPQ